MSSTSIRVLLLAFLVIGLGSRHSNAGGVDHSEAEICRFADWIFVGRVVEAEAFVRGETGVRTKVVMEVERVAHGAPPPFVTFRTPGGRYQGSTSHVAGYPLYDVGKRFLIFAAAYSASLGASDHTKVVGIDSANSRQGPNATYRLLVLKSLRIASDASIPDEQELSAIWAEHCSSPLDGPVRQRPTERYIRFLPNSMVDWCAHY